MTTIKIPFEIVPNDPNNQRYGSGGVSTTSDPLKMAEQQILDVLTTSKGERVMLPGYGANLRELMFEPVDDLLYHEYEVDASQELSRNVRIANIRSLRIQGVISAFDPENSTVTANVIYAVPPFGVAAAATVFTSPSNMTEETPT
jgi:phage baseplate assembly protein W